MILGRGADSRHLAQEAPGPGSLAFHGDFNRERVLLDRGAESRNLTQRRQGLEALIFSEILIGKE